MPLPRKVLEWLIFGPEEARRWTQDSPVLPDVWIRYGQEPDERHDLLLVPHRSSSAARVAKELREALDPAADDAAPAGAAAGTKAERSHEVAATPSTVVAWIWFDELVREVIPRTSWWSERVVERAVKGAGLGKDVPDGKVESILQHTLSEARLGRELERFERDVSGEDSSGHDDPGGAQPGGAQPGDAQRGDAQRGDAERGDAENEDAENEDAENQFALPRNLVWMARIAGWIAWSRSADPGVQWKEPWEAALLAYLRSVSEALKTRHEGTDGAEEDTTGKGKGPWEAAWSAAWEESFAGAGGEAAKTPARPAAPSPGELVIEIRALFVPPRRTKETSEETSEETTDRSERQPRVPSKPPDEARIHLVSLNRPAQLAVRQSGLAVKADAARKLFDVDCSRLRWAVLDSGIEARHPAFVPRRKSAAKDGGPTDGESGEQQPETAEEKQKRIEAEKEKRRQADEEWWRTKSRVERTFDFTVLRKLLDPVNLRRLKKKSAPGDEDLDPIYEHLHTELSDTERQARLRELEDLQRFIEDGRNVDWSFLESLLEIPHGKGYGRRRAGSHGTHVAGILAADWDEQGEGRMLGVAPDLRLYDVRVVRPDGSGDEFSVIAALQFLRWLNARQDHSVIHGINMSLSIRHDVANYACGRTPVCEEAERAVAAGIVVVAAAGNRGFTRYTTEDGPLEGYHTVSITDPGNAEGLITVGATHRDRPHTYGVSYFSSRGPTGDGRVKPDLVAPGEKITAPLPGRLDGISYEEGAGDGLGAGIGGLSGLKDGTSMAAPHVSGAAALLMARHNELIGDPARIKRILCASATDLGRERYFQGHGMLDVLRALQSV